VTKNTGVARLLRAIDMFMEKFDAGQVPTNSRGQIMVIVAADLWMDERSYVGFRLSVI
jgi:hypothetical protein